VGKMLTRKLYNEVELLSRHIRVLKAVMNNQPIGITRLSKMLRIDFHEVRNSLSSLENCGLIVATPQGAMINGNIGDKLLKIADNLKEIEDSVEILRKEVLEIVV